MAKSRQILNTIKKNKYNLIIKKSNSQILNQNSYKVSKRKIDKLGFVPDEIGSQIQEKSKEMGLYSANLPKKFGAEIDLRSYGSKIVLNHDPFKPGEKLEDYLFNEIYNPIYICNFF